MLRNRLDWLSRTVSNWPASAQYAFAIGMMTVAVLVRVPLEPLLGDNVPFLTVFTIMLPLVVLVRPAPFLLASLLGLVGTVALFSSRFLDFDAPAIATLAIFSLAAAAATMTAWLARRQHIRSESALRDSEARHRSLFEVAVYGIITIDERGIVESANPAAERLFGHAASDMIGRNVSMLMPEPYHGEHDSYLQNYLRNGVRKIIGIGREVVGRRSDGSTFPMDLAVSEFEVDGKRHFTGLVHDISERKQAEEALRESEAQLRDLTAGLESKVGQRTAELELQTTRLRRLANQLSRVEQSERKRLAALLHDDLQQLLVAARIRLTTARNSRSDGPAAAEFAEVQDLIDEAIQSSRDLTQELRPPALYEGGLVPALEALAAKTQRLYRIRTSISASKPVPRLGEDLDALLYNCARELLLNAAKHSRTDEASVEVNVLNGALHVVVSDKGKGFDDAAAVLQSSNGFGLFSIQERLAAQGGAMKIDSRAGQGCRVELVVPISGITPAELGADSTIPARPTSTLDLLQKPGGEDRCRVVIADDHPIVREGIVNVLSADKIRVIAQVGNGVDAIEAVGRLHPDAILLDVNMPRMNGIEAAREIHERWPDVVIIGVSVQNDEATVGAMLDAGAWAFISKTDDPNEISTAILSLVATRVPGPV